MTDYMIESLDLLPQPAALFECPEGRFVARNAIAVEIFSELPDGRGRMDEALRALGFDTHIIRGVLAESGSYSVTDARYGNVHMTRLQTSAGLSRPDLLLVTAHRGVDDYTAWMDHQRMVLSLRVNETADIAMRTLENTLVQVEGALSVQRDMLQEYNLRMSQFFRSRPPKKD